MLCHCNVSNACPQPNTKCYKTDDFWSWNTRVKIVGATMILKKSGHSVNCGLTGAVVVAFSLCRREKIWRQLELPSDEY